MFQHFQGGKLAQKSDLEQRKFFTKPEELFDLLLDPTVEILNLELAGDSVVGNFTCGFRDVQSEMRLQRALLQVCVRFKSRCHWDVALGTTSTVVASFVTSYGRLKLYSCLEKLGRNTLYYGKLNFH